MVERRFDGRAIPRPPQARIPRPVLRIGKRPERPAGDCAAGATSSRKNPPLTFREFLHFTETAPLTEEAAGLPLGCRAIDIEALNAAFLQYLNIGGYPEAVFNPTIRDAPERFIKSDIIDKVLLRDLPQLYGIRDIQELNRLFTTLAYNTGNEVTLEELAQSSGIAKTTLRRYIEYLEAAFLIRRIDRIDRSAAASSAPPRLRSISPIPTSSV